MPINHLRTSAFILRKSTEVKSSKQEKGVEAGSSNNSKGKKGKDPMGDSNAKEKKSFDRDLE